MSEWGFINLGKEAQNIDIAEPLAPFSGVRIIVGVDEDYNELVYFAGDESGRVLEVENPFGTQAMANAIFNSVRGYQYQPLYADGALLNPAAEIGDAVSVNGVYSGIYTRSTTFGTLMASDISAPTNEEVIHEFNIPTPTERKFRRLNYDMQSEFKTTAGEISAKVSKTSPQGQTSFGWSLQDDQWRVFNQSGNILRATASGLEVTGKIQADEGYIGGANGFVIKASAIYNGISSFESVGDRGVYLGTDGFKLGRGFKADPYGNVLATNLSINGGAIDIGIHEEPISVEAFDGNIIFYNWIYHHGWEEDLPYVEMQWWVTRIDGIGIVGGRDLEASEYTVELPYIYFNERFLNSLNIGQEYKFAISYSSGTTYSTAISPELEITEYVKKTSFRVDSSGNVTASSLNITGGTISIGDKFRVDSSGNVTASSLNITGGTISIGKNFSVTAEGDLYANSGTFRGHVSAGNVDWGEDDGYFDGGGLLGGSVTNDEVDNYINASLGYADFSHSVFNGWDSAPVVACDGIIYDEHPTGIVSFRVSGTIYNCIGWESSPSI